jgi:uncharacterized membrane protein YhhN
MNLILFVLAFGLAVSDWIVVARKNREIEKYVKPLTMIVLILWVIVSALRIQVLGNPALIWLVVGLCLCLLGDIFLFLPPEKWFVKGLIAFLLGHIGYILSFGVFSISADRLVPSLVLGALIIVMGVVIVCRLIQGLKNSGKGRMTGPIIIYSVVISFMLFSSGYKFLDFSWSTGEALLLAGGALLFYISDILNAWERFVSKFPNDRTIIMATYHLGQFGIAAGMLLHLRNLISF